MGALDLGVEGNVGARPHHALHPEAAAIAAGAAGIRHQRVALDHQRKFRLDLLVRGVVGVAVIDGDGAGDAVLRAFRAPAAAERAEIAHEEFRRLRIEAVELRDQEVGVMPRAAWR